MLTALLASLVSGDEVVATFYMDVVDLVDRKVEGDGQATTYVDRYGYRYLFGSAKNRDAFIRNPTKYEVQLGGSCGSMGPLSGRGLTSINAVHDGKIYTFASLDCRLRFLSMPDRLIDKDDPRPAGSAVAADEGRDLLDKVVDWCGGAKIDAIDWYQEIAEQRMTSGGKPYHNVEIFALRFPDGIYRSSRWNDSVWTDVSTSKDLFGTANAKVEPLHPFSRRAQERIRDHKLISLLKSRRQKGFLVYSLPARDQRRWLQIWFNGLETRLQIDPSTGQPLASEYVGRGPGAVIGKIVLSYTDFSDLGGVKLPKSWAATFDGKPTKSLDSSCVIRLDNEGISLSRPK